MRSITYNVVKQPDLKSDLIIGYVENSSEQKRQRDK
jgi:hypothetical protein